MKTRSIIQTGLWATVALVAGVLIVTYLNFSGSSLQGDGPYGEPFTLVDQNGEPFSSQELSGEPYARSPVQRATPPRAKTGAGFEVDETEFTDLHTNGIASA